MAARDAAALARPIRRWFWPASILVAVLTVVLVPFYDASDVKGLSGSTGGGPGGSILGFTYLPVLPLLLLGFFILLWNPLWRWLGAKAAARGDEPGGWGRLLTGGTFRLRARELLLLLVVLYAVISVAQMSHLRSLFVVDGLAKKAGKNDTTVAFYDDYNRSVAFPSLKGAQGGKAYEKMAEKLKLEHPEQANPAGQLLVKGLKERGRATLRNFSEQEVRFDQISKTALVKMKWNSLVTRVETGDGGSGSSPLGVAIGPVLLTSVLLILAAAMVLGLTAMTARQWSRHERLQYPLTQVPMSLVRPSILRSRGFQIGLGVVLLITCYNFFKERGWHPLPRIPVGVGIGDEVVLMKELWKLFGLRIPGGAKWVY